MSCLLTTTTKKSVAFSQLMSIIVSAVIFAMFHSVLLGDVILIVASFPGLILGWLFVKIGSLLPPIFFHGPANAICGFIAAVPT